MTNEKLEYKISELLNVSSSDKSITFLLFKKKLAEYLNIGEALKIKDLGVFQLKEQLKKTEIRNGSTSSSNKNVLVFSPDTDDSEKESLFLTLEIEPDHNSNSEFDENVFSLGIGKPIVPIGDNKFGGEDAISVESIDEKVLNLISTSEKLEEFDLWDDYLEGKQSTASVLDGLEEENSDLEDYLHDENSTPKPNDFVELDEDELLADLETSELFITDEMVIEETEIIVDEPIVDEFVTENIVELNEDVLEVLDENVENTPIETEDPIPIEENLEVVLPEEVVLEEESTTDEEKIQDVEDITNDVENDEENSNETVKTTEDVDNPEINNEINNYNNNEIDMAHPGMNNFKKGYSPTILALLAAFFIVGAIGIYYLFFDNPTWLYDQNEVEIALSEKHAREFEEAKKKIITNNNSTKSEDEKLTDNQPSTEEVIDNKTTDITEKTTETVSEKNSVAKTIEKEIIEKGKKSDTEKSVTKPKVIPDKVKKKETIKKVSKPKATSSKNKTSNSLGPNIFFDGTNYSVQISSWRDEATANREADRIGKKGYNTFVMEAFIPKYNANWYRVRIGDIETLEEAKSIQRTVK